ncbi:uncharacterized protein LOC111042121 isoform X2 [Myzus persicae]|uniref:uncharacterized protein LOC111042121 isoform X2 n=1 Tax=Myzus persicae TaxID=13164 RepID=UPI000B939A53|nr:uncharacterized protein LOC111042121 isoform X2 [Myzus persicae]
MIVNRSIRLPKMFWLNLSIFIVTTGQWWIYRDTVSAAETEVVAGQDESLFDLGSAANDRSDLRYFQQQVNSLMTVSSVGQPIVRHTLGVVPKPTPWRSRLSGGFFKQPHLNAIDKKAAARRRVTHRPKDAATGRDGVDGVTGDDFTDGGGPKTTTAATAARMLFGTENECVSTNPGRACVCYMTDFLDLICQRLNEAATAGDVDNDDETVALPCPSFKPVPVAFVIYPSTATDGGGTNTASTDAAVVRVEHSADVIIERRNGSKRRGRGRGGGGDEKAVAPAPVWKEIDFDNVVNYRLEKSSDDHYAVQYSLVGGDAKVPCLINGNGTRMNSFKWDFKKSKHKTNSTITGNDTNILLILGLEPGDSNNYTCIPTTDGVENSKNVTSYKHYVVAVENAIYEIRGLAIYKTRGGGGCTHEIIVSVQKQLPSSIRTELCPEGSSQYACNVVLDQPKCTEDKRTMEIKYLVTLNDKANYLARIRTSKKGRIALRYQKLLARISNVLASNLNKMLTVQIMSKLSLIDTHFEPDNSRMNMRNFVSCAAGFGIREVFCAACPPHHYSPDKSIECLKCVKGFHQPVAGSEKCVRCRNIFASGCYMKEVSPAVYWFVGFLIVLICSVLVISCACCCREENEKSIKIIPRKIRNKFKKTKRLSMPSSTQMEDTSGNSSVISQSYGKFKNLLKFKKKSKSKIIDSKISFNNVHEKYGQLIQDDHVTKEDNKTN